MKRLYIIIILLMSCAYSAVYAQSKNNATKKTAARTTAKMPEMKIPAEIFSVQELERQRKETLKEIELTTILLRET
ncbi:MAG: hypothetical protein LBT42_08985, partial [Tannerella sp.]|nr:hypothetical protein [Tannerella sp.]